MVKGLAGQKGRVILRLGDRLEGDYESVDAIASDIDRQILSRMELFPVNYWALSKIDEPEYRSLCSTSGYEVSPGDSRALESRLSECPVPDRACWLKMYANPVLNRHQLCGVKA